MEVMTIMSKNIISIHPDEPVIKAASMMKANNIRHLPVMDKNGFFMGMLSDGDIKKACTAIKDNVQQTEHYLYPHSKVEEFMSTPVQIVNETDSIEKITRLMLESQISCLLVENNKAQTTGIITTEDLLIYLLDLLAQEKSVMSKIFSAFRIS